MAAVPRERLSRLVSHALRHEPGRYGLELDAEGWVPVARLLAAVRQRGPQWSTVDRGDLEAMVATSAKRRHEIDGDRIRARYGHSVPGRVTRPAAEPPAVLFHGTSPRAWAVIRDEGLRPMGRQYVHLSADVASAEQVGRRRAASPVVLVVDAARAHASGVRFRQGNEAVWLADEVPPDYLRPR